MRLFNGSHLRDTNGVMRSHTANAHSNMNAIIAFMHEHMRIRGKPPEQINTFTGHGGRKATYDVRSETCEVDRAHACMHACMHLQSPRAFSEYSLCITTSIYDQGLLLLAYTEVVLGS